MSNILACAGYCFWYFHHPAAGELPIIFKTKDMEYPLVNQFWSWSDISVLFDLICLDLLQGTIFRSKQDIQPLFKTISLAVNQDQSRPNETDSDYRISVRQDSVKIKICIFRTGKILWQVTDKMCLDPLRQVTVCLFW